MFYKMQMVNDPIQKIRGNTIKLACKVISNANSLLGNRFAQKKKKIQNKTHTS